MNTEINTIIDCLNNGGVVLLPTDTVLGLAANPKSEQGVEAIYRLKMRPRNMPLPIMIASIGDIESLGLDINPYVRKLLTSPFVPGALSVVLGFSGEERVHWLSGREEVAIRIPNDERLLQVLAKTGPLLVTSANRHGSPTPATITNALADLNGKPDLVVEGEAKRDIPSTIVNCRLTPPVIERHGVVPETEITKILNG